jgi:hypothetical protein
VAISDFLALLYVRSFWVRMVRATLFCFASTWNWKPETTPPLGFAAVDDAKAALEPVFLEREREREINIARATLSREKKIPRDRFGVSSQREKRIEKKGGRS